METKTFSQEINADRQEDLANLALEAQALREEDKAFRERPSGMFGSASPIDNSRVIKVFYGTTRLSSGSKEFNTFYGSKRIQKPAPLIVGNVSVSIPSIHYKGGNERPLNLPIFSVTLKEVAKKHVMIVGLKELTPSIFHSDLQKEVGDHNKTAFVFVHGYNVTFADAARRAAQISNDLEAKAVPIVFSWASQGTLLGYFDDDAADQDAVDYLRDFLKDISAQTGASTIHLIAHSLGNEVLTQALKELALMSAQDGKRIQYEQVILAAPDVDKGVFFSAVDDLKKICKRVTHYVSSKDWALKVSHVFRQTSFRAGDSEPVPIVVPGIDTIDVSNVTDDWLGHNYVTSNRSILADIFGVLEGKKIAERFGIKPVSKEATNYYIFVP